MFFLLLIAFAFAKKGVDYSTLVSTSKLECLIGEGYTFVIPRCWCSVGSMDSNCVQNLKNGHSAGMSRVDAYFFPCYSCGNVAGQVSTFWSKTVSNKMDFTTLWFDIEGTWSSSYSTNQKFYEEMVNKATSIGINYGIYASKHYWTTFFGSSYKWSGASSHKLWYPHYDNDASFSDFSSFGGWSTPYIKQYKGTTSKCSASVDLNYQK